MSFLIGFFLRMSCNIIGAADALLEVVRNGVTKGHLMKQESSLKAAAK